VAGKPLGTVAAIHNFGAGDLIEIAPAHGPTLRRPFTNAVVPTVDIAGGRDVIEIPGEIERNGPHTV
jgi:16S rRNA processing protein RimM